MGEARDRRRRGAAPQEVVAIDQVDRPRRVPGRRDDGIELLLVQGRVEPLIPPELAALVEGVAVGLIAERSLVLRLDEQLLPKVGHLPLFVPLVERDDILQRLDRRAGREFERNKEREMPYFG